MFYSFSFKFCEVLSRCKMCVFLNCWFLPGHETVELGWKALRVMLQLRSDLLRLFSVEDGHRTLEAAVAIPDRYLDWPGFGHNDRHIVHEQQRLWRDRVGRQGEDLELKVAAAVGTSAKGPAQRGAIGVPLGLTPWPVDSRGLRWNLLPRWTDRQWWSRLGC